MINVMLVDNQKLFRESLKCLLEKNEITVSCDANSFDDCTVCLRTYIVDIILLDVEIDNNDGLKLLEFIRKKNIPVKVIILTGKSDINFLIKANELKTNGYLLKDVDSVELVTAINEVYNSNTYIQPNLIPVINNYLIKKDLDKDKLDSLTTREFEILKLIAIGGKNIDIAQKMNISERTVKNHLTHIFDKINVKDRTQAAVFAIKNDIIKL